MLYVTKSDPKSLELLESREGKPEWIKIDEIDNLKIFDDIKLMLQKIYVLESNEIFTAKSIFDDKGNMISFKFE